MTPEMIAILGLGVTGLSVAVALAALMVGMFARFEKRIDKRFDEIKEEIKEVKERIFSLEQRASALEQRVARLEGLLDGLREALFDRVSD